MTNHLDVSRVYVTGEDYSTELTLIRALSAASYLRLKLQLPPLLVRQLLTNEAAEPAPVVADAVRRYANGSSFRLDHVVDDNLLTDPLTLQIRPTLSRFQQEMVNLLWARVLFRHVRELILALPELGIPQDTVRGKGIFE